MRLCSFGLAALFAAAVTLALPTDDYVVHETRRDAQTPRGWTKRGALDEQATIPMKIGLTQRNMDKADGFLQTISHPTSPDFGKHWTPKEVAEAFAPPRENVAAVKAWLVESGIAEERIRLSGGLNWLLFDASIAEAEALLKTDYHVYEHSGSGQAHVACEQYSVPGHLRDKIDLVLPTVHFDTQVKRGGGGGFSKRQAPSVTKGIGKPGRWLPKKGASLDREDIISELSQCDTMIVPDCLRALYDIPESGSANAQNSYGIVEYTPQAVLYSDLDLFFANFSTKQIGERPIFDPIDGGVLQTEVESFDYNGESDLDLEYAMTLVYPQNVTLYQVGDLVEGASFNNFLDAFDASYCAGDDPVDDGIYPDPYTNYTGAYESRDCGTLSPAKVISTSYAYAEPDLSAAYEMRQCNEYLKLGLMGTTFLYSSGDYGVAGNGECLNPDGSYNNGTYGRFVPTFPGTCPYVLSIGATQVKNGTNIVDALASGTQPEEASETVIYSGGGFSDVFALPDYQKSAVTEWFSNYPPPYSASQFNNSQTTRGFPDVSANGANYVVAIDGEFELVYGTSCSSPTFGSVLTLINEARYNANKSSIGFVNPTLYAHPEVLNDITEGGNQGCGTAGFSSAPGWDPVTGLGTPNFAKMKDLFLSLP